MASRSTMPTAKPATSSCPGCEQAGVLGQLPADDGAAGGPAARRDPGHHLADLLGVDLAQELVVQEKEGPGAAAHQVVHAHGHQVDPTVSKRPVAMATAILVPTPSVLEPGRGGGSRRAARTARRTPRSRPAPPGGPRWRPPGRAWRRRRGRRRRCRPRPRRRSAGRGDLFARGVPALRRASDNRRADLRLPAQRNRDLARVVAGEAGVAETGARRPGRLLEGVQTQVGQAVGAQVLPDLVRPRGWRR